MCFPSRWLPRRLQQHPKSYSNTLYDSFSNVRFLGLVWCKIDCSILLFHPIHSNVVWRVSCFFLVHFEREKIAFNFIQKKINKFPAFIIYHHHHCSQKSKTESFFVNHIKIISHHSKTVFGDDNDIWFIWNHLA